MKSVLLFLVVLSLPFISFEKSLAQDAPFESQPDYQGSMTVPVVNLTNSQKQNVLVSTGIPFAPGQLTSTNSIVIRDKSGRELPIATRALAYWKKDQSIRSVLVQFRLEIPQRYSEVIVSWGEERKTQDLKIIDPRWSYSEGWMLLSKEWLTQSQVAGYQVPMGLPEFRDYDEKIVKNYEKIMRIEWQNSVARDQYYNLPHVLYTLYVRSGNLRYFIDARKEFLHYREDLLNHDGRLIGSARNRRESRFVYVRAMKNDYFLTGDPRSLEMAHHMRNYLKGLFSPVDAFYRKDRTNFWTEREVAFPLLGVLSYYEMTGRTEDLIWLEQTIQNLLKTQQQWPNRGGYIHNLYAHDPEEGCLSHEYGGSPFMTGLLLEGMIRYHQLTGDPRARNSILRAVDWLEHEGLILAGDSIRYLTCQNHPKNHRGHPDLNSLVVHAFGYAHAISDRNDHHYLQIAQQLFVRGVKNGRMHTRKHFSQGLRSSSHYLYYYYEGFVKDSLKLGVYRKTAESSDQDVRLLSIPFNVEDGGFQSEKGTRIQIDRTEFFNDTSSLKISGRDLHQKVSADLAVKGWDIVQYPILEFDYKIPLAKDVGLRVETSLGDWLCIGGTNSNICREGYYPRKTFTLIGDGQWRSVSVDVAELVHSLLPKIRRVTKISFFAKEEEIEEQYFWIDNIVIKKGNQ